MSKAVNNPPFEIIDIKRISILEELGDDEVYWETTIKTANYTIGVHAWFFKVIRYCEQHIPEAASYLKGIRKNIIGFGPKHSAMMEIIDSEGFELMPLITEYIKNGIDLDAYYEHEQRLKEYAKNPKKETQIKKKQEGLHSVVKNVRESNLRSSKLSDNLLKFLGNQIQNIYPEIFESDPKYIREFNNEIHDSTRSLVEKISSIHFNATQNKK